MISKALFLDLKYPKTFQIPKIPSLANHWRFLVEVMMRFLSYVFFSSLVTIVAFTRDMRYFEVNFQRDDANSSKVSLLFDASFIDRDALKVCTAFGCLPDSSSMSLHVNAILTEMLSINEKDFYDKYIHRKQCKYRQWTSIADKKTLEYCQDTIYEISFLQKGEIVFRPYCVTDDGSTDDSTKCNFKKIVSQLRDNMRLGYVSLDDWVVSSELVFNAKLYDHAEAMSYYFLKYLYPQAISNYQRQSNNQQYTDMKSTDIAAVSAFRARVLMLLSEVSREKGFLEESTNFSFSVMQHHNINNSLAKAALHNLRVILTVPPIPPPFFEAEFARSQMVKKHLSTSKCVTNFRCNSLQFFGR